MHLVTKRRFSLLLDLNSDLVRAWFCKLFVNYGLKSSGASWQAISNSIITDEGSDPTIADPDDCTRPNVKPNDFKYYHAYPCVC